MKRKKGKSLFKREELHCVWHRRGPIGVLRWLFRELRFACQRVYRGYCDSDVWNLYSWFLDVVPDMLLQLKETGACFPCSDPPNVSRSVSVDTGNLATGENTILPEEEHAVSEEGLAEWRDVLDRIIFLFHEADEERCERKNAREEEFQTAYREFIDKYGMFGEKLRKPNDENGGGHRLYTLRDVDEYRDIAEEYLQEAQEIDRYRAKCKDEAFQLFSQWFYGLWD